MIKAGRELDALVAEKVMGWRGCDPLRVAPATSPPHHSIGFIGFGTRPDGVKEWPIPNYSTSIADAFEVAKKLRLSVIAPWNSVAWVCDVVIVRREYADHSLRIDFENNGAIDDSAPLAICLAALKAVGVRLE